jgi:hypothetical protein
VVGCISCLNKSLGTLRLSGICVTDDPLGQVHHELFDSYAECMGQAAYRVPGRAARALLKGSDRLHGQPGLLCQVGLRVALPFPELSQAYREIVDPLAAVPRLTRERLHDLRHTFAVHRLTSWYRQGADVQRLLQHLSVYLGHVHIRHTQVYLSMTPELLHEAGQRFERYARKEACHD